MTARTIGARFHLDAVVGSGSMGEVYRAVDALTGGPVAVKLLRATHLAERFVLEANLLADLAHPAIVRYVAHGRAAGGEHWLAMEWLAGEDLAARLRRGPLTLRDSLTLGRRVASALAVAHARGVVHRDIKPSNLYLGGGQVDQVKVLDFGIARARQADMRTEAGTWMGTPQFMAPEQVRRDHEVDARADVFALGAVLFACLTGKYAFDGEHLLAVLAKILLEETPRVSELAAVPRALDDLVARMLAKEREGRPTDGAAVEAELLAISDADPAVRAVAAPRGLTRREQRVLSVILTGRSSASSALAVTLPLVGAAKSRPVDDMVSELGGRLDVLPDGVTVITLVGDQAATDQAGRAARCAQSLEQLMPGTPIAVATGLGMVAERLPVGEVIDRAAALLQVSRGRIALDDVTAGLLAGRVAQLGEGQAPRTLLKKSIPCVGRDRELAGLQALLAQVIEEKSARVAMVTGEAGAGKSRLGFELLARIRGRGIEPWTARADPLRGGSFALLAQIVRGAAAVHEGQLVDERRARVRARVARHVAAGEVDRVAAFLGEIGGVPFPDSAHPQLRAARETAGLLADQMRRAWEDWLAAECDAHPVVLVLEDLQWGDLPTVSFIEAAARWLADKPLFVLALARPEVHERFPALWHDLPVETTRLAALSRKASEKLVRAALGDEVAGEVVARIVEQAGGNAFYLEEMVRASADGLGAATPGTVLAMVQSRLEALPPDARRVLRAASVFGHVFWDGGLAALCRAGREEIVVWLDELTRRELVVAGAESRFAQAREFTFRHALLHDSAYAMLTPTDRQLGHKLAAKWLQRVGETDPPVMAEHYERGGEPVRAAPWYRDAAEQALTGNDLPAVLARTARGLASGVAGELRGELLELRSEALAWRGDYAEAESFALQALPLLAPGGGAWFRAVRDLAVAAGRLQHGQQLADLADEVLAVTPAAPEGLQLIAVSALLHGLTVIRDRERLAPLLERLDRLEAMVADGDAALSWATSVRTWLTDDIGERLRLFELAARQAQAAGDERMAFSGRVSSAACACELGAYARAEDSLRAAIATSERLSLDGSVLWQNLGLVLLRRGALGEARTVLERALDRPSSQRQAALTRLCLARTLLAQGHVAGAVAEARSALAVLAAVPTLHAYAQAVLARALLAGADVDGARQAASRARALIDEHGEPEEGASYVRLTRIAAAGDAGERGAAVADARGFVAARAAAIADPELRRSFLEAVEENAEIMSSWRDPLHTRQIVIPDTKPQTLGSYNGPMIGETFGSYQITGKIGSGAMGVVYLARHPLIGRKAAVKLLLPEYSHRADVIQRFFNEARTTALIKHPGLIDIFDFGYHSSGAAYLVMEFLEGETLAKRLADEECLPPMLVVTLVRQLASAVGAAHGKGIVHRDLKPDNIFLVQEKGAPSGIRVKIVDFGIAKLNGTSSRKNLVKTQTGSVLGTPLYMSPEQCRGSGRIDQRSDIYAIGCIMFEMLTGTQVFDAEGVGEMLAAHMLSPPPRLGSIDPSLPLELDQLVQRMLAKDPKARPQSLEEVDEALIAIAQELGWHISDSSHAIPVARRPAGRPPAAAAPPALPLPAPDHRVATLGTDPPTKVHVDPLAHPAPPIRVGSMDTTVRRGQDAANVAINSVSTTLGGTASELSRRARRGSSRLLVITARVLVVAGMVVLVRTGAREQASHSGTASPASVPLPDLSLAEVRPAPPPPNTPRITLLAPIDVTSEPSGAEVYLLPGGELLGRTPLSRTIEPSPKERSLRITRAGYRDVDLVVPAHGGVSAVLTLEKEAPTPASPAASPRPPVAKPEPSKPAPQAQPGPPPAELAKPAPAGSERKPPRIDDDPYLHK